MGATGFVGSAVARRLLADGHDVSGLARTDHAEQTLRHSGIRPVNADLDENVQDTLAAAAEADATVYAAQLTPGRESTVVGSLLNTLAGRSFVFVSGTGVFMQRSGGAWSQDSFAEDDSFDPEPLAAARVATEREVRRATDLSTVVVRPPYLWGPGEHGHLSAFYRSFAVTGAVCYVGQGLNCYSHLHVDDAAALVATALEAGNPGALYHGVAGELPNRWIAEAVAADLGCATRSITMAEAAAIWGDFDALIMGANSRCRATRTRRELDWRPTHTDLRSMVGKPHLRTIGAAAASPTEGPR